MLSPKNIVLIGGAAGSGKDTVANFLCDCFGFHRIAYADALKQHVSSKYNIPINLMYSQEGKNSMINVKNTYMSVRNLLIKEGTDTRLMDSNIWVNEVKDYICKYNLQRIVIPDFRFINEYTVFYKYFPSQIHTLKIVRPDIKISNDISEHQLDNFIFDNVIVNDGTIEQLKYKICNSNLAFTS